MSLIFHNAIRELNPSVITICGDIAYDANGDVVEYDKSAAEAKAVELQANKDAEQQATEAAKQSALTKLAALGLTDAEIKALTGN